MQGPKNGDFNSRREAADLARKAMIERFRAQPRPEDPVVQERLAAKLAVAEAREARRPDRLAERAARAEAAAAEPRRLEAEEAARLAEDWFDPDGLIVAAEDGRLLGFHWTKRVGEVGEVYVVPAAAEGLAEALQRKGWTLHA